MKSIMVVAILCLGVYAANKANTPHSFISGTAAKASEVNTNFDSLRIPFNKVVDTLNYGIPRWKSFSEHDSIYKWMNIDTIPDADTINTNILRTPKIVGSPTIDNITGTMKSDSAHVGGGLLAARGTFASHLGADTITVTAGTYSPRLKSDSSYSVNAVKSTRGRFDSLYVNGKAVSVSGISSFQCTLTGVTGVVQGTAYYYKVGQIVTLWIPGLFGASNSTYCGLKGIPTEILPTTLLSGNLSVIPIAVIDSGYKQTKPGSIVIFNENPWEVWKTCSYLDGLWTTSLNKGIEPTFITYLAY